VAYTKLGDYTTALRHCDRAVEISPAVGVAYNNRGVLHALMQNFTSAGIDFEAAVSRSELHEAAIFNKSRLSERVSDYDGDAPADISDGPAV
jgi:tetratricopeptide (TPR) repeat protein